MEGKQRTGGILVAVEVEGTGHQGREEGKPSLSLASSAEVKVRQVLVTRMRGKLKC